MTTDPIADAFRSLGYLDDAVKHSAYNCDCQVGGVDAMSVDTDWLRAQVEQIRRGLLASWPEENPVKVTPSTITIDLSTGKWQQPRPITFEQACTVAASVLPGKTPTEVAAWYDEQFDTPGEDR